MTTIPPTAAPPSPVVSVAPAGPVVVIQQPTPQLLQLPPGTTVEAVALRVQQQQQQQQTADTAEAADQTLEARQTLRLRTSAGDVTVRMPLPVDDGAKIALEILRSAPNQVTARVVTIDGQPAQQVMAQSAREVAQQAAAQTTTPLPDKPPTLPNPTQAVPLQPGQAWTPSGPAPLVTLNPLSAFVLNAPITPGAQLTALQPNIAQIFQPGADLGIRVVSVQTTPLGANALPGAQPAALTPSALPGGMQVGAPTPGAPITPQVANALNTAITPPTTASSLAVTPGVTKPNITPNLSSPSLTPTASTPATSTPSATAPAAMSIQATETPGLKLPGPQGFGAPTPTPPKSVETSPALVRLTGQVTGTASNGAVMVQTSAGEMQLNVRANLPVGSTITLEILASLPPRPDAGGIVLAGPTPSPLGLPLSTPAMGWSALTESLQLLQRIDPQAATQLANAIPDGGPRTAAAAMAFAQAMRTGDARQWPGDSALRGLERASPRGAQLAAQIAGEVSELARRSSDAGGEWRTLPMPWNAEGQIERIAMITRREGAGDEDDDKKKGGKGKGTRFLVNLNLSRLGEMQLDGMFNKATRALEMMIRTKTPLPDDMRQDLAGLFANSNAAMGLKGGLSFQVVKKFPDPTATGGPADRGGLWA